MSEELINLSRKTNLWEDYLPSTPEWMDDIEPLNEFFSWLTNCVSDQNCITPEELNTYYILLESGKIETEEELANKNYLPENVEVYPHSRDLVILEDFYRQNQMRLANHEDYFKLIKIHEKTLDYSKLGYKIDQMLDNEIRRVNYLIAGDYRRSALDVAAKCSQMNENMKNVSESVNILDLICLSSTKNFFDRMEYLKSYVTKSFDAFQEEMNKKCSSFSSVEGNPDYYNVERIFNDCVNLKASIVEIQSWIEGVAAIGDALDLLDPLNNVNNGDHPEVINSEDLFKVCYDQVRTEFLKKEVKYNHEKLIKRREILAFLDHLRNAARPLKRCGESFVHLIKEEFKWIRINRAILSDTLGGLQEIQHEIDQSYKQLVNIRTVHELSSVTHTYPDISSTLLKFFDASSSSHNDTVSSVSSTWSTHGHDKKTVETVMSRMYAGRLDSTFKMMKSFSEDVMNLLSFAKMAHRYLFNGPSATFSVDSDLISSIIRISRELNSKKQALEKLDCRRFEVEIHRRNIDHRDLFEKFWLLYIQNPHQLRQTVEAIEERSQLSRNHHHASRASDGDFLEKFLL